MIYLLQESLYKLLCILVYTGYKSHRCSNFRYFKYYSIKLFDGYYNNNYRVYIQRNFSSDKEILKITTYKFTSRPFFEMSLFEVFAT